MKKQIKISNIAPILGLIFTFMLVLPSCEPEIVSKIDLPEEDPKLSISCYLIPSENEHILFVGRSKPHNKPTQPGWEVTNAVVKVSDGTKTVVLKNLGEGYYSFLNSELQILPGGSYTISAYAPGFTLEATGSCTIPEIFDPMLQFIAFDSVKNTDFTTYTLDFKVKDMAGTADQYRIMATMEYTVIGSSQIEEEYMYATQSKYNLFKDEGNDGGWFPVRFQTNFYQWGDETTVQPEAAIITVLRTDEPYFKFNYPFVVKNYYPDDNPFAEPVIIYSNITNGYGIFCGAVSKTYKINL